MGTTNIAVIVKIEYKRFAADPFELLLPTMFTTTLTDKATRGFSGVHHLVDVAFKLPRSNKANDTLLHTLASCKHIYRLTDANGVVYMLGANGRKASMIYSRTADGKPGGWNGYDCVITYSYAGEEIIAE